MANLKYKRVLLKIGGEALAGHGGMGVVPEIVRETAAHVKEIRDMGVEVAMVIGAGNWWRGKDGIANGMDRTTADQMGMLATVMNALAMRDALEQMNVPARVQTAIEIRSVAEPYIRLRAIRHLDKGRVVILGGGTGNPYFSTDSAGALRAMEINCDVLIKATKVDGVYDSDPRKNPNAKKYDTLSYQQAVVDKLGVMDGTAFTLCMDNKMPIMVLNLWDAGILKRAVFGERVGTLIS
jgi:uridylate kinase